MKWIRGTDTSSTLRYNPYGPSYRSPVRQLYWDGWGSCWFTPESALITDIPLPSLQWWSSIKPGPCQTRIKSPSKGSMSLPPADFYDAALLAENRQNTYSHGGYSGLLRLTFYLPSDSCCSDILYLWHCYLIWTWGGSPEYAHLPVLKVLLHVSQVQYIWKSKPSKVMVLYLILRYFTAINLMCVVCHIIWQVLLRSKVES